MEHNPLSQRPGRNREIYSVQSPVFVYNGTIWHYLGLQQNIRAVIKPLVLKLDDCGIYWDRISKVDRCSTENREC